MFALSLPMPTALALTFELALGNATHHSCSINHSILPLSISYRISNKNESFIVTVPAFTPSQLTVQLLTIHFKRYRVNENWLVIYRSLNFRVEILFRSEKKRNHVSSIIRSNSETQISNDHRFWYTCCTKFCYHQAITVERTTLVKNGIAIFSPLIWTLFTIYLAFYSIVNHIRHMFYTCQQRLNTKTIRIVDIFFQTCNIWK